MHQSGGLMFVPGWTGTTPYVSLWETAIEFFRGARKENEMNPFGICEMSLGREILLRNVKCAAARSGFISFHWMRQYPITQCRQVIISHPKDISFFTLGSRLWPTGRFFARLKNSLFCDIISSENKNLTKV